MFIITKNKMTTKEYLINIARQREAKSFIIRDGKGDVVHIADTPASLEQRTAELEQFLNNNTGVFRVELRSEYGHGLYPRKNGIAQQIRIGEYDVMCERAPENKPINGLDFMSGINGFEIMRSYEREKQELKEQLAQLRMEKMLLERDIQSAKESFERELSAAKSSDNKIMGYLGQLGSILNPAPISSRPINGVADVGTDAKQRLVAAVNKLAALDSNLAENLEKLAALAENNPAMYKQATTMLNSMS